MSKVVTPKDLLVQNNTGINYEQFLEFAASETTTVPKEKGIANSSLKEREHMHFPSGPTGVPLTTGVWQRLTWHHTLETDGKHGQNEDLQGGSPSSSIGFEGG